MLLLLVVPNSTQHQAESPTPGRLATTDQSATTGGPSMVSGSAAEHTDTTSTDRMID